MATLSTLLGGLDPATFLREYWHKKPLLIRGAYPDFTPPVDPDELAGLACEEGVESRIVETVGANGKPWQASHGPFNEETFARLGERDWTLLVQAVDHYVPEVAEMLEPFRFIPAWRLDDIMISYAPPGGSVGPHMDNYDVFLIQTSGKRRWQLGGYIDEDAPIIKGIDLRILEEFEVDGDQDWVLEPGDMLYLPPRIAHNGISESDDCMTYSVGFRAPSADELITSYADYKGEQLSEILRYADADLTLGDAGEIDDQALERTRRLILDTLDDPKALAQWFGRYMTQVKYPDQLQPMDEQIDAASLHATMSSGVSLVRALGSRFAYRDLSDKEASLFVDGDGLTVSRRLAHHLASTEHLDSTLLADARDAQVLATLVNRGSLILEDDDSEDEDDDEEPGVYVGLNAVDSEADEIDTDIDDDQ